ncbi:hypothetical protein BWQ96_00550 [Gracilariopsis chorda]|uniref:Uncharacterized protein n=1 Tax=Gracilariopsis chorda TaxID=448386 RepID=A0A2V3J6B9_9FLOR|nr:hypothetical protein BWQ96_00550 [Gracilariopsis chorda]|eukprot:PXF49672.1 hypothetical protein BWQ96_00550 [Gracilariopsis chorda]
MHQLRTFKSTLGNSPTTLTTPITNELNQRPMARVSKKALRPRSYVLGRLPPEKLIKLQQGVQKLLERERHEALVARARVRAVERTEAQKHAENILNGVKDGESSGGNEHIRSLVRELEELKQKRSDLFAALKKGLEDDATGRKNAVCANGTGSNEVSETVMKSNSNGSVDRRDCQSTDMALN